MMGSYKKIKSVLTVGLGNPSLTSDALGPETVKHLAVTFPVGNAQSKSARGIAISAFAPDVAGNTGIETAELIRGIVNTVRPTLVIAIDALAARSAERLASVIQLSDGGISPGSGLGNRHKEISHRTLGIPVIALGIPTVVPSSAMMAEVLSLVHTSSDARDIQARLEQGRRFFVTPKEIDLIVRSASLLLADAIHRACGMDGMRHNVIFD